MNIEVCYVDGRQDDVKEMIALLEKRLADLRLVLDRDNDSSELSVLNGSPAGMKSVSEDLYTLLSRLNEVSQLSDRVWDVAVGPLTQLWHQARLKGVCPSLKEIAQARQHVGMGKFELRSGNQINKTDPLARLDLSAEALAFAADEAVRLLTQSEFHNFMVSAGSGVYASGANCQGRAWRVVIKDPEQPDARMDFVDLSNSALAVAGDMDDVFTVNGRRWSGIISPVTGYPHGGVARSVVLAPSVVEAASLSRALCLLGPEQGLGVIGQLGEGYDALMLFRREKDKYEWHSTPGYEDRRVDLSGLSP